MLARNLYAAGFCFLMLLALLMAVEQHFSRRNNPVPQPVPAVVDPVQPARTPVVTASTGPDQADAVRAELRETSRILSVASANIDQALKQIDVWGREVEPLRHNTAGMAIQQQPELAENMVFLLDVERPGAESLKAAQGRIEALRDDVDRLAAESQPTRLSAADMREILQLQKQAAEANRVWQDGVEGAQAIVNRAQRNEGTAPANEAVPLADSIDRKKVEEVEKQREKDLAAKNERQQEEEAVAALREAALAPEVKQILAPFLARRLVQPRLVSRITIRYDRVPQEQPMSLTRLINMGALNKSTKGLEILARVGTHKDLPDPRWSLYFESRTWSDDQYKMLLEAQRMLREYGQVLVDEGLLTE